ncbi:hypothetical protein [Flavobacterium tegetincola]|uniref:hypothetical protein n=1 Tax=Flavobacterium tegetincola TaxID=150172 RepID=UPI000415D4BC|nr:hypothetical protein [Flavobacterium tegetincola]
MTIDKLILHIRKIAPDKVVQEVADTLQSWKTNEMNSEALENSFEKYLGNIWLENNFDYLQIYSLWSEFKRVTIDSIGGMTMNERLFHFGLVDEFENASTDLEKEKFYLKLMARR